MKRTDTVTKIVAILLFLTVLSYAGASLYSSINERVITAEAVRASVSEGGVASGIIIREETVLVSAQQYIDITASNGKRVAIGQTIATAMKSEVGLARAERIHELELEVERLSAILGSVGSAGDITSRDETIRKLIFSLTGGVSRGEIDNIDSIVLNLSSLVFTDGDRGATQAELDALQSELQSLKGSSTSDTENIVAVQSGIFSTAVDGYEHLGPDDLEGLTPSKLNEMISSGQEPPEAAFGKIVSGIRWYFAAVMPEGHAANLEVGETVALDFGRYYSGGIEAKVLSISAAEDGNCAVTFACSTAMSDTLNLRSASAEVMFETYDGIRIPSQAIRADEDGATYVYVATAMQIERKDINILYLDDSYAIVERQSGAGALREGNTVVVSGNDLYEGKVLR